MLEFLEQERRFAPFSAELNVYAERSFSIRCLTACPRASPTFAARLQTSWRTTTVSGTIKASANELIPPLGRTSGRAPVRCWPRMGDLLNYYYRVA